MKKLIVVLLAGCLTSVSALAALSAGNPVYDPFANATNAGGTSYTPGSYLTGQTSTNYAAYSAAGQQWWEYGPSIAGGTTATNQPVIVAGDLSYPSLLSAGGGQSVAFGGNGDSALMNLTTGSGGIAAGTIYFSYVLKFTDLTALDTNGTYFTAFNNLQSHNSTFNTPAALAARVMVRSDGAGGFNIGLQEGGANGSTGFNTDWGTASFQTTNTLLIVGSYIFNTGGTSNDLALLWINPDVSTFGGGSAPAPDLVSSGGNADIARVASFVLLVHAANEPEGQMDDVRVGLNWADVTPNANYLNITQNPVNQTAPEGYTATFTVVANGSPPLSYQWTKNGNPLTDGGNIFGSSSNILTISNVASADLATYAVYVTNGFGAFALSSSATLTLSDPSISSQPQSRTNNFSTTATFSVTATGTGPFTYQWQKNGASLSDGGNVSGSWSNLLTLTNVAFADQANYSVIVSNALGASIQSLQAFLTVNDPVIVTNPMSTSNVLGSTVTFHVVAIGTPTLFFQWYTNGIPLSDDGVHINGAFTDTLTISDITAADATGVNYTVQVYGYGATASNRVCTLTIISPVTVTAPPNPRTVAAGDPAVLAVGASGSGSINYQWLLNGNAITGATSFAYALTNAQTTDAGNYSVIVSGPGNSVTSAPVALTVVATNLSLVQSNLVVIRVGSGAETLSLNGNSMFLDQFSTNGDYFNTVSVPNSGAAATVAIGMDNASGNNSGSTTGSGLTLSLDGRYLVIAGYNTNLNYGNNLATSFGTNVARGIGLINSHAQYTLGMASTNSAFDQAYWRTAITDGTNNYWGVGSKTGTYYFGFSAPGAVMQNFFVNSRSMGLYNGNIYCAQASNPLGILEVTGMPTNSTTATNYLFAGSTGTSDMAVSPDGNLIYVADQRGIGSGGGLQRWDFSAGAWSLTYTLTNGYISKGPRYVTADFSGPNPVVYVTTDDNTLDNNRILQTVDTGVNSAGTTLAYAGVNETFRGIHFGPVASAASVTSPTLYFASTGANMILNWTGSFILQSATNVAGPYVDVSAATSPYTNSVSAANQMFFRLRD